MKSYTANDELIEILKRNGFFEITTILDRKIQKLRFKCNEFTKKELVLYNQNIAVHEAGVLQDKKAVLTEEELRIIILYLKISRTDSTELLTDFLFKYSPAIALFNDLEIKLQTKTMKCRKARKKIRIERMQKVYNEIKL